MSTGYKGLKLRLDTPFGPLRIAYELKERGISISPHGVYNVLKRRNLNRLPTFKEEREIIRYEKKKPFEKKKEGHKQMER